MNQPLDAIAIRRADLTDDADLASVVGMINDYARDPMGNGGPLPEDALARLPAGLRDAPGAVAFLVEDGGRAVGGAMCFRGFSTYSGRPKLYIHDFSVNASHRGRGLGHRLMRAVVDHAEQTGCEKLTLEVRADNAPARAVYAKAGFGPGDPPWEFWTRDCGSGPA